MENLPLIQRLSNIVGFSLSDSDAIVIVQMMKVKLCDCFLLLLLQIQDTTVIADTNFTAYLPNLFKFTVSLKLFIECYSLWLAH